MLLKETPRADEFFHYEKKLALIIRCHNYSNLRKQLISSAEKRMLELKTKFKKVKNESI